MNYSILNRQEVLRLAEPETDLEIALVKILEGEVDDLQAAIDNYASIEDDLGDEEENSRDLSNQVDDLEEKVDDLDEYNGKLKSLLDEHNIDHKDI